MDTIRSNKGVIIGVIVALVIGLLIGYGVGRGVRVGDEMTEHATSTSSTAATSSIQHLLGGTMTSAPTVVAEGNSVSVEDQPAGMSVMLASATLSQEAWIAVRDSMGRTLGAALFPAGTQKDVTVPLLRTTSAGENYQVLVYFDDGTKTFNLKTETIVLNPDGTVAGATFLAQ